MPEKIKPLSELKNKILTGLAAGVMGAHPVPSDISPHRVTVMERGTDYEKVTDRISRETREDKELRMVESYVLQEEKKIHDLHSKNMPADARVQFLQAIYHLVQSYLAQSKKYSSSFLAAVSRHVYALTVFEGGYCASHDEVHKLYEGGMTVSPRLALDSAALYHKDGNESERMRVLSKGYELASADPDWHAQFDIGEEYALALGMSWKVEDALKVYQGLFDMYQGLIARNMITVDIHVQTIVDGGDFKKVEPYVNEQAFQEYAKYREESFRR